MTLLALWRSAGRAACAVGLPRLLMRDAERAERLGDSPSSAGGALWVHAASVGETSAAAALVRAVRTWAPRSVALSTTTVTGRGRASVIRPELGPFLAPIDAPGPVQRALERLAPAAYVTVETELWPTLLDELSRRGVPWGVASARLGERSFARMQRVRGLYEPVLRHATAIAARSDADAERFRALGVPAKHVRTTGDLKEDREVGAWEPPRVDGWIAACTRPGEELIVLQALATLVKTRPRGELAIAPRHPERFEEVASICSASGVPMRRWRDRAAPAAEGWSIVLVDEMGVLDEAYRRATCAFVGGSLAPLGGHSPWEAAAAGRAVLTGPHVANCRDAVESLRAAGAAVEVRSADELAARVASYLSDPAAAERAGRAARATLAARSGVGKATVEFFRERQLLP